MKNILILTTTSDFLEKFEKGDVEILKSMGYNIHYAANTKEEQPLFSAGEVRAMGIKIHTLDVERSPYMLKNNMKAFLKIKAIIKRYHIQVIHCHTPVGGVLGRLAGKHFTRKKVKVIYTAHGFHFYRGAPFLNNTVFYLVERLMAHYTDFLVVINQEDYESAVKFRLRKGGKVYQIPGVGLDLEKFSPLPQEVRRQRRAELGIKEDEFFLVSVGELNQNKNQIVVLKMLARIKKRQGSTNIKYGICGDGFYREKMKRWIKGMNLENEVFIYGFTRNVPDTLGCADALIFPSKREGLGMAALEALAMGIPVLAADNRGTREYMEDGKNGYICRYDDVEGFIKGIEKLKNMSLQQKEDMRRFCRDCVKRFDKRYSERIMRNIYREIDRTI